MSPYLKDFVFISTTRFSAAISKRSPPVKLIFDDSAFALNQYLVGSVISVANAKPNPASSTKNSISPTPTLKLRPPTPKVIIAAITVVPSSSAS